MARRWDLQHPVSRRLLLTSKIFEFALFALVLDRNLDVLCMKPMNTAQVSRTIELYWSKKLGLVCTG